MVNGGCLERTSAPTEVTTLEDTAHIKGSPMDIAADGSPVVATNEGSPVGAADKGRPVGAAAQRAPMKTVASTSAGNFPLTNPLEALGCSLDGGVLYVSRVPVSAGEPHMLSGQT